MDQLHSKEPWTLSKLGHASIQVIETAGVGWPIAMLHQPGDGARECMRPEKFATLSDFDHQANGRRIVACVNACEGIADAELSHGPVLPLHRHSELANQRDELRDALYGLLGKAYKQNWNEQYPDELAAAEHAIAKAKGSTASPAPSVGGGV